MFLGGLQKHAPGYGAAEKWFSDAFVIALSRNSTKWPIGEGFRIRRTRAVSGSKLFLCFGKSEFLEFDSLSENPFDPLVHTGLAVQAGQECCARR